MKNIEVQEKKSRGVRIAVATAAGAAAIAAGMNSLHTSGESAHQEQSTVSFSNDEMETGVLVQNGDTGELLAQTVNGGRLSGNALREAGAYVDHEGVAHGRTSSGATHYDLEPGQTVSVPVLTDQQIQELNKGDS